MGFDVTLHPVDRKEFKFFIEDVFDKPYLMDTKAMYLHDKEKERAYLVNSIYSSFPKYKKDISNEGIRVETSIGFAASSILGYLHPYWYLRNGILSDLLKYSDFQELTSNLSLLVEKDNSNFFNSGTGAQGNYSSGIFIEYQNISKFLKRLRKSDFINKISSTIGEENLEPLIYCLKYCDKNHLDLLEAIDLCIPITGEYYTLSENMKALHLKNISDHKNYSKKNIPKNFCNVVEPIKIDKLWWNNLNEHWREEIKISYSSMISPKYIDDYTKRNLHVDEKFNDKTLDLSYVDKLEELSITIIDQKKESSSLSPFFAFPNTRSVGISSYYAIQFDIRRILQFPNIEKLSIGKDALSEGLSIDNFASIKELKKLRHLKIGIKIKPEDLKEIENFKQLTSLFLALSPMKTINFLQGNDNLEALTLSYTKGLKDMPNLKRLYLYLKEKEPVITNCPNIQYINCWKPIRLVNLAPFKDLTKLRTLIIRMPNESLNFGLLNEMTSIREFYVDNRTNLKSISQPIDFIETIFCKKKDLDEKMLELVSNKFPNAKINEYVHYPYE